MKIGNESSTAKIDKKGVCLLTSKLLECDDIECHLNDEDKIPNSDGYFIIKKQIQGQNVPFRRFDVQIKSTENPKYLTNDKISLRLDINFINYANLKVSTDPCILFHVDVRNKKIFFKLFTDSFLEKNYNLDNDKEYLTIHFDTKKECINNLREFYEIALGFAEYKKEFNIKKINIIEYQKAYEIINDFFDKDFLNYKLVWFKNVWKFGIAYQNNLLSKEEKNKNPLGFDTQYGVYTIEYGEKTLPFQQIDIEPKKSKLSFIGYFMETSLSSKEIDITMKEWFSDYIHKIFDEKITLIPFLPEDAIFEILVNKYFIKHNSKIFSFSLIEFEDFFKSNWSLFSNYDRDFISCCILTLKERHITTVVNPLASLIPDYRIDDLRNIPIIQKNTENIVYNLPKYYKLFIKKIFGEAYLKYEKKGNYFFTIQYTRDNGFFGTYSYVLNSKNAEFTTSVLPCLEQIDGYPRGSGILDFHYKRNTNILMDILLTMLYKKICEVMSLKYQDISNSLSLGKI